MDPNSVNSPISRISNLSVLYTDADGFSIAALVLDGYKSRVAMRWDGEGDGKGFPTSHGKPTWFIIPKKVALAFARQLDKADMVQTIMSCDD